MNIVSLTSAERAALWDHLLGGTTEQVAFLFAEVAAAGRDLEFQSRGMHLVAEAELSEQEPYHISLTQDGQSSIIKQAWDRRLTLVEFHSHRGPWPAEMSASDWAGLRSWVPYVRWRLGGLPYAAVVASERDLDGLVWNGVEAEGLALIKAGTAQIESTGLSLRSRK